MSQVLRQFPGRQQQQRQFRKVYQPFSVPTTAGIAIWLGLASVAKMYTGRIKATEATATNKEQKRRGLAPEIDGLTEVSLACERYD